LPSSSFSRERAGSRVPRCVLTSKSADDPSAELEIEVVVDERPGVVDVDPYYKLIDSHPLDNLSPL